jgi:hypothetical protein
VCKVLRSAVAGTVVGYNAKRYDAATASKFSCTYDDGDTGQWSVTLNLNDDPKLLHGPQGQARMFCKPLVAHHLFTWLSRAESGADVACSGLGENHTAKPPNNFTHAYFASGRWFGELMIRSAPLWSSPGYIIKGVVKALSKG